VSITASGLFVQNMGIDVFDATQMAINLSLASHKLGLVADALTPNFDTNATWANVSGNEVSGSGWAAGGIALSAAAAGATSTSPTLTISPAGTAMYDMGDVSVANTTLASAMAAVLYADALADELILLVDFVTAVSTTAGTLGIQWAAAGVFTLDLTP
jgi:hypothetical protein